MARPQFSIRTLLWLTLVVAAFLGGIEFHKARLRWEERQRMNKMFGDIAEWERLAEQQRAKRMAQ
jgi:hypothetical protein